ncbi:MAG: DUF3090 family protein [Anaerolineae bacterium]|nr:DUF3090 family protein [Anaerolineae bacterium]MDW8173986.1 DUF3090 family protein [Anaerolineae bacterium]
MARLDLELRQLDFITIGTIGPKGQRVFHLQAGQGGKLYTFVIEKEQAWALGEALREFLDELDQRLGSETRVEMAALDMELREPILPLFRVAQMGLGYDAEDGLAVLVVQELSSPSQQSAQADENYERDDEEDEAASEAGIVRMWTTRQQLRALSLQAMDTVEQGRPNPRMNGRITYYWT